MNQSELNHVREYMKNRIMLNFSSPAYICDWILSYLFDKHPSLTTDKEIKLYERINKDEFDISINSILNNEMVNIVSIGNYENPQNISNQLSDLWK